MRKYLVHSNCLTQKGKLIKTRSINIDSANKSGLFGETIRHPKNPYAYVFFF